MASIGWDKDILGLVREFTVFTQEDAFDAFEKSASDVATAIMQGTPLGVSESEGGSRGTLRNNWQISRQINDRELKSANPSKGRKYSALSKRFFIDWNNKTRTKLSFNNNHPICRECVD